MSADAMLLWSFIMLEASLRRHYLIELDYTLLLMQ